ncbi:MAG: hypothetical protein LBQ83_07570 [Candidatus Margulisbacteria bacterium]|jgi:hypothetical protein|nr:hypothetical protein [Candidatus Margulisiibacteriota bacterium]
MFKYLTLVLLLFTLALADNNAVDFLQTGLSARSLALGNTGAAAGGHIDTVFLNPAALQEVSTEFFSAAVRDFDLVENKMFALAGAFELRGSPAVWGFIYAGAAVNGLERTGLDAEERPVEQGTFNSLKNNYTLALARRQRDGGAWYGVSLRRYLYTLDDAAAEGTGLDLGGRWHLRDIGGASIFGGVSLRNICRTRITWSTGHEDTMPFGLNSGLSVRRNIAGGDLLGSLDWRWREEQEPAFSGGLEYALPVLALRVGWEQRLTYGLGLRYYGLSLDYARTLHEDLGLQQRVSLLLYL